MVVPLIVALVEIAPEILSSLALSIASTAATSVVAKTFDDTSKNICACLDKIDKTLISGFAGLGIKIDQLPGPLAATGRLTRPSLNPGDFISTAAKRRDEEEAAQDTRTRAQRRADAQALGRRMIGEGQLPGAAKSAATALVGPVTIADQLKGLTETLATLGKTISEALQPTVDALDRIGKEIGGAAPPADPISLPGLMPGGPSLLQPVDGGAGLDQALGNLEQGFAAVRDRAGEAGLSMTRAFRAAIDQGGGLNDVLGGLFDALGGIGGKAGELIGLFGNLFRGGGLGDLLGGLGGIFGFAGGGTLQPRLPAIVGERGPELFIPSGPGRIASGSEARGLLGGAPVIVNQSITLATDVRNTVRAEIAHAAPLIAEATRRGLIDDFMRRRIL